MKNVLKLVIAILFLLSISFYLFVIFYKGSDNIEFRFHFIEILHQLNYFLIFPILATIVFMHFFRKKKEIVFYDYFTSWIIIAFFFILVNSIPSFDFCAYEETKTYYVNIENNSSIVYRSVDCGIFDSGDPGIQLKSTYFFILNKYEEKDTNSLDLSIWTKI